MRFRRRRSPAAELEPVTFVPVYRAFKPQAPIRMLMDVTGYVGFSKGKAGGKKWQLRAGKTYAIDEDKARDFVAKGYAEYVYQPRRPISELEAEEAKGSVSRIGL